MIRRYRPADRAAVLELNEMNLPDVGPMDDAKLDLFVAEAAQISVVEIENAVVGIMVLLGSGSSYQSPNYLWFSERYEDFVYVDRIALAPAARGQGWGPALYEQFEAVTRERGAPVMLAEVNTVPRNDRSLRFHSIAGFDEVARCRPYGGDEQVAMLVKPMLVKPMLVKPMD